MQVTEQSTSYGGNNNLGHFRQMNRYQQSGGGPIAVTENTKTNLGSFYSNLGSIKASNNYEKIQAKYKRNEKFNSISDF